MIKKLTALTLVFALILSVPVFSQSETSEETSTSNSTTEETEDKKAEREARAEQRREKIAERLSEEGQARIAERCIAAQEKLNTALTRLAEVSENRNAKYTALMEKLGSVATKLSEAGVDTGELETSVTQTQTLIDEFIADFDNYTNVLDDTISLDCQDNPQDFKLALEDAKLVRLDMINSSQAINMHVKENVKTILLDIKSGLESGESATSDAGTDESEAQDGGQ